MFVLKHEELGEGTGVEAGGKTGGICPILLLPYNKNQVALYSEHF